MEMTKWEYTVSGRGDEVNQLGKKGWEAYGVDPQGFIMLKRPCGRFLVDEIDRKTGKTIFSVENDEASYDR